MAMSFYQDPRVYEMEQRREMEHRQMMRMQRERHEMYQAAGLGLAAVAPQQPTQYVPTSNKTLLLLEN